jgi:S-DNA-T family DNA segregation ATPase FtsK/SpoIIIE
MLFQPPGRSEPMRLQGAFIGTAETERVMQWYEDRRAARLAAAADPAALQPLEEDILALVRTQEAAEKGEGGKGPAQEQERDALFRRAAEECINNRGGSTSLLQRRLGIGYGRAARIIDQLETAGILSPTDGNSSRPRDVLIGHEQLDEYAG